MTGAEALFWLIGKFPYVEFTARNFRGKFLAGNKQSTCPCI